MALSEGAAVEIPLIDESTESLPDKMLWRYIVILLQETSWLMKIIPRNFIGVHWLKVGEGGEFSE